MADDVKTPDAAHKKHRRTIKVILIVILILLVILGVIMWYRHNQNADIDAAATKISATYGAANADEVKAYIMDTVDIIRNDWTEASLARKYASDFNISYGEALVDLAVGKLKEVGKLS